MDIRYHLMEEEVEDEKKTVANQNEEFFVDQRTISRSRFFRELFFYLSLSLSFVFIPLYHIHFILYLF